MSRLFARGRQVSRRLMRWDSGSALVEFAISLPLLVVLVVGIFDFGGAFNQKQILNNAAREGARFGASQPTNDLCTACTATPGSVDAIRYLVDSYLLAAHVNDCGLSSAAAPTAGPPWAYTANTGCAGTLTLTIDRGYSASGALNSCPAVAEVIGGVTIYAYCTKVTIAYPYQSHFNNVIQLVSPGATFASVPLINTNATAVNMD